MGRHLKFGLPGFWGFLQSFSLCMRLRWGKQGVGPRWNRFAQCKEKVIDLLAYLTNMVVRRDASRSTPARKRGTNGTGFSRWREARLNGLILNGWKRGETGRTRHGATQETKHG